MTISQTTSSVNIEIIPALKEQEPILANLLELYVYDFSEFLGLQLGADGRFGYQRLPLYWEESDRYPFLIKVDGHWAGFVFVRKGSEISGDKDIWDMAEFFVVRSCRRLGIGLKVTHEIWNKFPGKWEVRVMDRNPKAREFWGQAISRFIHTTIEPVAFNRNGEACHVFSFESKSTA